VHVETCPKTRAKTATTFLRCLKLHDIRRESEHQSCRQPSTHQAPGRVSRPLAIRYRSSRHLRVHTGKSPQVHCTPSGRFLATVGADGLENKNLDQFLGPLSSWNVPASDRLMAGLPLHFTNWRGWPARPRHRLQPRGGRALRNRRAWLGIVKRAGFPPIDDPTRPPDNQPPQPSRRPLSATPTLLTAAPGNHDPEHLQVRRVLSGFLRPAGQVWPWPGGATRGRQNLPQRWRLADRRRIHRGRVGQAL
jgi:hypothetical protein